MLVVVTGRSGVGKSTILDCVKRYKVVKLDEYVKRELYVEHHIVYQTLVKKYGNTILNSNQTINYAKLGQIFFTNPLAQLEIMNLIHPYVQNFLKALANRGHWLVEMATYINYETMYRPFFDYVILITRDQPDLTEKFTYLTTKQNPILNHDITYDLLIKNTGSPREAALKIEEFVNEKI